MQQSSGRWGTIHSQTVTQFFQKATGQYHKESLRLNDLVAIFKENQQARLFQLVKKKIISPSEATEQSQQYTYSLQSLCYVVSITPQFFIQLISEEIMTSQTTSINLSSKNHLIMARIIQEFNGHLQKVHSQNADANIEEKSALFKQIFSFLNIIATKIRVLYDKSVKHITKQLEQLHERTKKSALINPYSMFKIFREISFKMEKWIQQQCQDGIFRNCLEKQISRFIKFVLNKFENVSFFVQSKDSEKKVFSKLNAIAFLIKYQENAKHKFILRKAVNSEGRFGVFIKTVLKKNEKKDPDDYLIKFDEVQEELIVMNCKNVVKKWFIYEAIISTKNRISSTAKDIIQNQQQKYGKFLRESKMPIEEMIECQPLDDFTNSNGVLGKCLATIRNYDGASDFFKDFTKRAILSQSIEQVFKKIPIVAYVLFAGHFSLHLFKIFNNGMTTNGRKIKQLGGFALTTTTTIGSGLMGAVIGQALIPIPIVGALIGTVFGGILGQKGGKKLNSLIEEERFFDTILWLKKNQVQDSHWLVTKEFYHLLEIKQKEFIKIIPAGMRDYVFCTLVCFVLVCFYEGVRMKEKNKKQEEKDVKPDEDQMKKTKDIIEDQKMMEKEIVRINGEDTYKSEFDVMKIIGFLEDNLANLMDHIDVIQKQILPFMIKMK